MISQRAIDLIVSCEVSSRATYEKKYRHPEWPGGRSGVTVGIGYDLGYCTLAKLHADWDGKLAPEMIRVMERCLGAKGDDARKLLPLVRSAIDVSWDAAMVVFLDRDVPEWTVTVERAIPGADKLSPDCKGSIVSEAYNRGASFNNPGDRYREMRDQREDIIKQMLAKVPLDIRASKRLWPGVHGLQARRDAEAALFEQGLRAPAAAPEKHIAPETPAPLPPKPAGAAEHGTAGGAGAVAGRVAHDAVPPEHIWSLLEIALAVGGVIAVILIVWFAVRQFRKAQPVVAREKDIPPDTVKAIP